MKKRWTRELADFLRSCWRFRGGMTQRPSPRETSDERESQDVECGVELGVVRFDRV